MSSISKNSDDGDMTIDVRSSIPVDPKVVDINMLSEAITRIVGGIGQLLQILHAQDATDSDKEYVHRLLKAMISRIEHEFTPYMKEKFDAVKH